jgi:solute carrier family 25 carnitine/acylcarnitine transporter 20/29
MFMDSVMLGSLTVYRRLLSEHVFHVQPLGTDVTSSSPGTAPKMHTALPSFGHGIAGILAGATVSFIAAPVEHIKARLQIQYAAQKSDRLYAGPIDCLRKIYRHHGLPGVYHGLSATLLFRAFFFFWWGSYDNISRNSSSPFFVSFGSRYFETVFNLSRHSFTNNLATTIRPLRKANKGFQHSNNCS